MHDFLIREIVTRDLKTEMTSIGFDDSYVRIAENKYLYKNLKIFDLSLAQVNILKQTALSVGADCATHKEVVTGQIAKSNCILGGSYSQICKIAEKLHSQPFGLKELGEALTKTIKNQKKQNRTQIVGVLNLTTNSFSDGGQFYQTEDAINQLNQLIQDGADIIDIGAESTKPYSEGVTPDKQLEKLYPVLDYVKENNITVPISIDTRSAQVAEECIKLGAAIINDVSGLTFDKDMAQTVGKYPHVKIIIQHSQGIPQNMQLNPHYVNIMDEIYRDLYNKIKFAVSKNICKENIIIDPGIGFGKLKSHNFEIINRWQELNGLDCPVMIGLSRKSLLGCPDADNREKDIYTLALDSILIHQGIDYLRVHNVRLHKNFEKYIQW